MKKLLIALLAVIAVVAAVTFVCQDDWCRVFPWQNADLDTEPNGDGRVMAEVRNVNVVNDQQITSPLTVSGEARGNWYFEANLPVLILDANRKVVAQAGAQAQGEWMTTEFVPFTVTLTFTKPETPTGWLVIAKDNPSGLPEHDASFEIPIKF